MNLTVEVELGCPCTGHPPSTVRTYAFAADTLMRDWLAAHQGPDCCPQASYVPAFGDASQDPEAWAWVDAQLRKVDQWIAAQGAA